MLSVTVSTYRLRLGHAHTSEYDMTANIRNDRANSKEREKDASAHNEDGLGLFPCHLFKYTNAVAPSMTAEPTRSKNMSRSSIK